MIQFESVDKIYPNELGEKQPYQALHQVSFHLAAGQSMGMIGPNGAGKSTCIRLMMGFMRHTAGSVRVLGDSPLQPLQHQHIGYLPEVNSFPQNLSCIQLLRFATKSCSMPKVERESAIRYWLSRLGLWDVRHRLLRNFSKGMQQRTSFAMALVHDPKLLILDEPMSGLDPVGRMEIVTLIQELKEKGKTILFCSHVLDDVERLVDHVLILHQGRVCFQGKVADLCEKKSTWQVMCQGENHVFTDSKSLSDYIHHYAEGVQSIEHHESFEAAFLRKIQEQEVR